MFVLDLLDRIKAETEDFLKGLGDEDVVLDYLTDDFVFQQLSDAVYPDPSELEMADGDAGGPEFTIIYGSKIFRLGTTVHFLWVDRNNNWRCTNQAMRWDRVSGMQYAPARCSGYQVYQLSRW